MPSIFYGGPGKEKWNPIEVNSCENELITFQRPEHYVTEIDKIYFLLYLKQNQHPGQT